MNPFPNNSMPSQNRFTPSMFMTPQVNAESVAYCMWDTTHEMMMDWYGSIKQKIEKF